jgi:FixJ family two-component response regulator
MHQNMELSSEIFIVDDDALVRETMSIVFTRAGSQVTTFCEGESFIATALVRIPACVLMDICMPGPSGLDILKQLKATNYPAPIFIVSGRGDIPIAVEAIKNGACDFIEKRMDAGSIVERVGKTIDAWARPERDSEMSEIRWRPFSGRTHLTRREIDVLKQITAGVTNKVAARNLGISSRTIEVHRRNILKKFDAKNAVHLLRIVMEGHNSA